MFFRLFLSLLLLSVINPQNGYSGEGTKQERFINKERTLHEITGNINLEEALNREIRIDATIKIDMQIEEGGLDKVSILIKSLMFLFPDIVNFKIEIQPPVYLFNYFKVADRQYLLHLEIREESESVMENRPLAREMMENLFIRNQRIVTFKDDWGMSRIKSPTGKKSYFYFIPSEYLIYQSAYHISAGGVSYHYYDAPEEKYSIDNSYGYLLSILHELSHLERMNLGTILLESRFALAEEDQAQDRANAILLEYLNLHNLRPFYYDHGHSRKGPLI